MRGDHALVSERYVSPGPSYWQDRVLEHNQILAGAYQGDTGLSDKQAYSVLRVALRNAFLRASNGDTEFCTSSLYREIERGDIGVGDATDILTAMLNGLQDIAWNECSSSAVLSEDG